MQQEVSLWDLESAQELKRLDLHTRWSKSLQYHPQGQYFASAGDCDNEVLVCQSLTGGVVYYLNSSFGCAEYIHYDPSGDYLVLGSMWGISVWHIVNEEVVFEAQTHEFPVEEVVFSPKGSFLASAGRDGQVHIWALF